MTAGSQKQSAQNNLYAKRHIWGVSPSNLCSPLCAVSQPDRPDGLWMASWTASAASMLASFSACPSQHSNGQSDHLIFLLKPLLVSQVTWNTIPTPSLSSKALHHLPCLPPQGLYPFHLPSLTSTVFLHHPHVPVMMVSGGSQNRPQPFYFRSLPLLSLLLQRRSPCCMTGSFPSHRSQVKYHLLTNIFPDLPS